MILFVVYWVKDSVSSMCIQRTQRPAFKRVVIAISDTKLDS